MILVLGGTSDALEVAAAIFSIRPDVMVSTATEYGSQVSLGRFAGKIVSGKMDQHALRAFIVEQKISCVVDVSHPYAENISRTAIAVCQELAVRYCRYERLAVAAEDGQIITCADFTAAGLLAESLPGNIFMTIGKNHIAQVLEKISDHSRVKVRVLPQSETILELEKMGLNADHIIAIKGPFSEEMNYLMFRESGAAVLLTKDSGTQGGTDQKIEAARRLGLKIILISRPEIEYPNKFSDQDDLLDYLRQLPA